MQNCIVLKITREQFDQVLEGVFGEGGLDINLSNNVKDNDWSKFVNALSSKTTVSDLMRVILEGDMFY